MQVPATMQDYHFFGVQAKPNKAYDVQVQDGRELHITAACVEVDSKKPSSLHMKVENNDFVVAAFGGGTPFHPLLPHTSHPDRLKQTS